MAKQTGWVWHELFNWHNVGNGSGFMQPGGFVQPGQPFDHPATKGRFAALVQASNFDQEMTRLHPSEITDEEALRVHTREYLDHLYAVDETGGEAGQNAVFGAGGLKIAKLAAGATAAAVRAVLRGEVDNAYALVRPAGHHAEPDRARGYCLLANTSIAAKIAQAEFGVKRIAIVDWDVHHGNGTQAAFWSDPSVLNISIHQEQLFPVDSGFRTENGAGVGEGHSMNIPLPAGTGDDGYLAAVQQVVIPALEKYQPELIIVGSGMDASLADPLGRMVVTSEGFRAISREVIAAAERLCDGKVVFSHEGGYSAEYVPFCGMAVLEELTQKSTGITDPYMDKVKDYPQRKIEPWQQDAVNAAAELVQNVPQH